MKNSSITELLKKALAVTLGITMALAPLMLPVNMENGGSMTAYAAVSKYVEENGCRFYYMFTRSGTIMIHKVVLLGDTDTVVIPSKIDGAEVTDIYDNVLKNDYNVRSVEIPDTITYIGDNVLKNSAVVEIKLSDYLEHIGDNFASECRLLSSVECSWTDIPSSGLGRNLFHNCVKLINNKGALCLGNWLMYYAPLGSSASTLKIVDLPDTGTKIDSIAPGAVISDDNITTVDLDGIRCIGDNNFSNCTSLTEIVNDNMVMETGSGLLENTPWLENAKENDLAKLGRALIYYKTDSDTIDFTQDIFRDIYFYAPDSLKDCTEVETLKCSDSFKFNSKSFYIAHENTAGSGTLVDHMPAVSTYKIKDIFLDGERITYDSLMTDTAARKWVERNFDQLKCTEFIKTLVEEKTKEIFRQMDMPYYGLDNTEFGVHTPEEEFYIRLKIHNYMAQYDYDHSHSYPGFVGGFLLGGSLSCDGYAELCHLFLEAAGVDSQTLIYDVKLVNKDDYGIHYWNSTKIGSEWFESDDGWDAQKGKNYEWFALSAEEIFNKNENHHYTYGFESIHDLPYEEARAERGDARRTLGDINGDDARDEKDAALLWEYIKGESQSIDNKKADINFDGTVDVTDAVLLENFVSGDSVDEVETDGLAQKVRIAFLNGTDYDDIKYLCTDREGYITLPESLFEVPRGKKLSYDAGEPGEKVRITDPMTVVNVKWEDVSKPDSSSEPDESSTPDSSAVEESSSGADSSKPDDSSLTDSSTPNSSAAEERSSGADSSKPDSSSLSDSSMPDKKQGKLGDVNNDGKIDIEDAVAVIQHINGLTPLKEDEEKRADVSKDKKTDIDDAVMIISYINGNSTF